MKAYLIATMLALSCTAKAGSAAQVAGDAYLFDVLKNKTYRKAWDALFIQENQVDNWLARYAKTKDGPATPSEPLTIAGKPYRLNFVCKTHDCGDNFFYVIFNQTGDKAWGILLKNNRVERFFGQPDAAQKAALRQAAQMKSQPL